MAVSASLAAVAAELEPACPAADAAAGEAVGAAREEAVTDHAEAHGTPNAAATPVAAAMARSAWQSARRSAIVGAAVSLWRNGRTVVRKERTVREAASATAADTAASAALGAVVGAASAAARAALSRAGLGIIARTAAPVAMGMTAVDIGRDALARRQGHLTEERFRERLAVHAFRGVTTWSGLELGAALGTLVLPGVGTVLGSMIGGAAGSWVGTALAEEGPDDSAPCCEPGKDDQPLPTTQGGIHS